MTPTRRTFSLHVQPADDGAYSLTVDVTSGDNAAVVARLDGPRLERLRTAVIDAVTTSKHPRTIVSPTRRAPIPLTEDAGVRLTLTALATAPLTKPSRVEAIRIGISSMTSEEALYWYAHCTGPSRSKGLTALRTLVG